MSDEGAREGAGARRRRPLLSAVGGAGRDERPEAAAEGREAGDADRLRAILAADPVVAEALQVVRDSRLPDGWVASGALYGAVWNALTGRPPGHGLKDVDVIWFDPDESWAAEDAAIRRLPATVAGFPVEGRNQARTHLWFPRRFGFAYPRLTHATQSLRFYATATHAVAARLTADGLEIAAPFGLTDLFALRLTPNPALPNRATHEAKAARIRTFWPEAAVAPWPPGG